MPHKQRLAALLRRFGLMPLADRLRFWLTALRKGPANAAFRAAHPELALPDPYMIYETFRLDYRRYYESGLVGAEMIRREASPFMKLEHIDILDWGCGPGRVIRRLPEVLGAGCRLHGCDYNEVYIRWCKTHLPGIDFRVNGLYPPLPHPAASMDLVYSISILTHLSAKAHEDWITELHRVLRPGGLLLLTTHGLITAENLVGEEAARYGRGELVVRESSTEGHRLYAAFQPPSYMQRLVEGRFAVLSHRPGRWQSWGPEQDIWVLQKLAR